MGDCNVCLYFDDCEPADVFHVENRRARKTWHCDECRCEISVGNEYEYAAMLFDGEWTHYRTCLICSEIRGAFSCGGVMYGGEFWPQFTDMFPSLNSSCLDKLKTPAAKAYLLKRWRDWKGLAS